MPNFPKITSKRNVFTCPWISVVESKVRKQDLSSVEEAYYAIEQPDYVTVVAQLEDGRIPVVRQYRPAVDAFTLELPAGTVEQGETPEFSAVRELEEETGASVLSIEFLGSFYADTGRLSNYQYVYFMKVAKIRDGFISEPGLEALLTTENEIIQAIKTGRFRHQLHIGAFFLAQPYLTHK